MANAARLRWEQHLEGWLAKEQHGFLPCRSMLSNVVDLELAAMHATLEHENPAIMLFDFSAAFPSISQEFLFRTLENLGLPRAAVQLVKSLYFNHKGFPVLEGARGTGFCMSAGIRQGCPLSPLLFVVAVDGLLRRVGRESPGTSPWMFADDTSMVMQNFREALPRIAIIFKDLQEAAQLSLNIGKCIFIPLFIESHAETRARIDAVAPAFREVAIQDHGKYLGYFVGPGKKDRAWNAALDKAEKQVLAWDWAPLGLYLAATVWNTFIIPLLGFVAQLEAPPANTQERIEKMLRRAAHGPYRWCQVEDLLHLQRAYGFSTEYKDIRVVAEASMFRTACLEDRWSGGLHAEEKSSELRTAYSQTTHFNRSRDWGDWFDRATVHQMAGLARRLRHNSGITRHRVESKLAMDSPRPWQLVTTRRVQKGFQKAVTQQLRQHTTYDAENRIRQNLRRFGLLDRRQAANALRRLRVLGQTVPPRVWAATHGCLWNRWATARRRQHTGSKCLLGCEGGEDSIEHYTRCSVVHLFASSRMQLRLRFARPLEYWMLTTPDDEESIQPMWWEKMALVLYAVLRTTNAARLRGGVRGETAERALWQAAIEGAKGTKILRTITTSASTSRTT